MNRGDLTPEQRAHLTFLIREAVRLRAKQWDTEREAELLTDREIDGENIDNLAFNVNDGTAEEMEFITESDALDVIFGLPDTD